MMYRYLIWLFLATALLTIGSLCYLQGEKSVVAIEWLNQVAPSAYRWLMAVANSLPRIYYPGWIANHLADIMWSMSFAMLICGIWVNQFSFSKLLLVGIACAIFYEVLQLVGAAPGIFDVWDLFYSLCAGAVGASLTYLLLKKYHIKEQYNENLLDKSSR